MLINENTGFLQRAKTFHVSQKIPTVVKGIQVKVSLLNNKTAAMALFPFILLNRKKKISQVTINHERIHLVQQLEMLVIPFYIVYIIELVFKGYRNISFEREAYKNERNMNYVRERKFFSWIRYYHQPGSGS